jgi:hypothetical protein
MINLNYPNILDHFREHIDPKRSESASFLIWYLENYYRLDAQEAIDAVCDQKGDKGVDGIYINEANGTIDIFQTKISQKEGRTIGDTVLKEFFGTLSQFNSKDSIQNLIDSGGQTQVVGLIKRLQLLNVYDQYKIRGVFICNMELDRNGDSYLEITESIEFIGKASLISTYISDSREVVQNLIAEFDIVGLNISKHFVDTDMLAYIVPIKATELVNMPRIADQSVFAYNVRGSLGNTTVNKGIVKSIKDKTLHKKSPLFHNGITIVTNRITESEESGKLSINTFFVVNGCQSLTALFKNQKDLTEDLRILTKFVQVPIESELSKTITHYSNNQNGVKARDFKSNSSIQVRLQNEFANNYGREYFYEVKRGETNNSLESISNELAGILIMSFDLKEPWGTHRKYQVFDDKYNEIFGKPEVTAHHVLMIYLIDKIIVSKLSDITNRLVAKYALTRFTIIYILRQIYESDAKGKELLIYPEKFIKESVDRIDFISATATIIDDIIIDFNGEVENLGDDFDYKSKLRDENWIKKLSQEIVSSYLKQVARNRIDSFENEWNKKVSNR